MKIKYSELVAWAMAHEQEWAKINGLVQEAKAKELGIKEHNISRLEDEPKETRYERRPAP